jgi:hypothetical protein
MDKINRSVRLKAWLTENPLEKIRTKILNSAYLHDGSHLKHQQEPKNA